MEIVSFINNLLQLDKKKKIKNSPGFLFIYFLQGKKNCLDDAASCHHLTFWCSDPHSIFCLVHILILQSNSQWSNPNSILICHQLTNEQGSMFTGANQSGT